MSDVSQSERTIFVEALDLPDGDEREAYLDEACAGDAQLRERVRSLLEAHQSPQKPLARFGFDEAEGRPAITLSTEGVSEAVGDQIGRYKLQEQIGEGGMGVVYVAEQIEPVRRKVALKIIKPGMDTKEIVARFEAERQALALMDHPHIARVLDGGASNSGRSYFVMELVHGVPITEYCDNCELTTRERLALFGEVCQAIQHAHQKGIIHRDIKPTNVLVAMHEGTAVVKVIDFGVAKAINQELTERTLYTRFAQMIGTPQYMSPEQAEMSALDVDTRSDIYSLGVLLYELLTGTTPLEFESLREAGYDEIRRMVREDDPPRPSARLSTLRAEDQSTVSRRRQTESKKLVHLLRGELDWIVMKTLEKDRARRYETASALAADVQRYLSDEPVQARPPSMLYRFGKFARRNRRAIYSAIAICLLLLIFAGSTGWLIRDRRARQAAVEQRLNLALQQAVQLEQQRQWSEALATARQVENVLESNGDGDTLRQRVGQMVSRLDMIIRLQTIRSDAAARIGDHGDSDFADAQDQYQLAFRDAGINPADTRSLQSIQPNSLRLELASALDAWAVLRRHSTTDAAPSSELLFEAAQQLDPDEWRNRLRQALANEDLQALKRLAKQAQTEALPPTTSHLLADALHSFGKHETALSVLQSVHRANPNDFWINFALGSTCQSLHDTNGAIRFYTAALALRPGNRATLNNLANALSRNGLVDEAIAIFNDLTRLDSDNFLFHFNLGAALEKNGDDAQAMTAYREAAQLNPEFACARHNIGNWLRRNGNFDAAVTELEKSVRRGPQHARHYLHLGLAYVGNNKHDQAVAAFREAVRIEPNLAEAHYELGLALGQMGDFREAFAVVREAIRLKPDFPQAKRTLAEALQVYARLLQGEQEPNEAIAALREAIEIQPESAEAHFQLARALWKQGRADETIFECRTAFRLNSLSPEAHNLLGNALFNKGLYEEAIAEYRSAVGLKDDYAMAYNNLGAALVQSKRGDESISAFGKALAIDPNLTLARDNLCAAHTNAAWKLAMPSNLSAEQVARALKHAERAIALCPESSRGWQVLGWAHGRSGRWSDAIQALQESCTLQDNGVGDPFQWLFLAMAHKQLGHDDEAQRYYKQSVENMAKTNSQPESLRRLRAEAERVLSIQRPAATSD